VKAMSGIGKGMSFPDDKRQTMQAIVTTFKVFINRRVSVSPQGILVAPQGSQLSEAYSSVKRCVCIIKKSDFITKTPPKCMIIFMKINLVYTLYPRLYFWG
jgi:hypothetical protein